MRLSESLSKFKTFFLDTAPIIYYIEAHPQFGSLAREVVGLVKSGSCQGVTSVITLAEVLPKPTAKGEDALAKRFSDLLKHGKNLRLIEISTEIAEFAGELRGNYPFLKSMDAMQIATAIIFKADAFVTNDDKLKRVSDMNVLVLKDYL